MLKLPDVFSDGALFQGGSKITVNGIAGAGERVICEFSRNGRVVSAGSAVAGAGGNFAVNLSTPVPSFDEYSLSVRSREEERRIERVLFGEIWMATGQSNMELPNIFIPGRDSLMEKIRGKKIRVFHVSHLAGDADFPWEPDMFVNGFWADADNTEAMMGVSALALKFAQSVYDHLNPDINARNGIPFGFADVSYGGTPISAWLDREAMLSDPLIRSRLEAVNNIPDVSTWNTKGAVNFQQASSQYNAKIAPVLGMRFRGILWYQGENECGGEYYLRSYEDFLRFLHGFYRDRFAADPDRFMLFAELIYNWVYGDSGECNVGYLNDAIIRAAAAEPDKFAFVPLFDLEPEWSFSANNHPIHPTHKYPAGERLAKIVIANVYGEGQKTPVTLKEARAEGNIMKLTFSGEGALRIDGSVTPHVRSLYLAGENGIYLPAEMNITGNHTAEVRADGVDRPVNAAYCSQSLDPGANLFGGDYPVAPFFTDRERQLNIEARPWYDTNITSAWVSKIHDDVPDIFYRPVWQPLPGSEICTDRAFRSSEITSLRVAADDLNGGEFGAFVRSYSYMKLDLYRFSGMTVDLYNMNGTAAYIRIITAGGVIESEFRPAEGDYALSDGWGRYRAEFGDLSADDPVDRMQFVFVCSGKPCRFVNIERPRLFF